VEEEGLLEEGRASTPPPLGIIAVLQWQWRGGWQRLQEVAVAHTLRVMVAVREEEGTNSKMMTSSLNISSSLLPPLAVQPLTPPP
jgi:hypothetical protein